MKGFSKLLIFGFILLLATSFSTPKGYGLALVPDEQARAINWSPEVKLKWSDFKAKEKTVSGFAIAYSTCGFGYDGIINGDLIKLNIYVRFYSYESWKDPNYNMADVLQHEQLHFDIAELYGRKFYHGIKLLRQQNNFNERTLSGLYDKMQTEYDQAQDRYDAETDHSTNSDKQEYWNSMIKKELERYSEFSNYKEY